MSSHLAFIDIEGTDQAKELRDYLISKGAQISAESKTNFIDDCKELVDNCAVTWRYKTPVPSEAEVEGVMNSLVSLIILVADPEDLVTSFCNKVTSRDDISSFNMVRLRILSSMFNGYDDKSKQRLIIYMNMLKFAGHANLMQWIPTDMKQVKHFMELWAVNLQTAQSILRALHHAYIDCNQKENASKVMIELLASYTDNTAVSARDDAQKCIITSLADPSTFLLDHLLTLKPVQLLEGEKIYQLLMIFVNGSLSDYRKFYQSNKGYVDGLGLNHEQNEVKMKFLTLMSLTELSKEIPFSSLVQELDLDKEGVEQFIINAAKTGMVMAKIDQLSSKVIVSTCTPRTFNKQNWIDLKKEMEIWQINLNKTAIGFSEILKVEVE